MEETVQKKGKCRWEDFEHVRFLHHIIFVPALSLILSTLTGNEEVWGSLYLNCELTDRPPLWPQITGSASKSLEPLAPPSVSILPQEGPGPSRFTV